MLIFERSAAGEHTTSCSNMSTVDSSSRSQHWDGNTRKEKGEVGSNSSPHKVGGAGGRGTNSSTDPTVQSSRGEKTSSNVRIHPKAELKNLSNSNHTPLKSHDRKRKSSTEDDDSEDVWTEHKSSSGRIYFYNKKLDKSQWEKPTKGTVKKLKTQETRVTASSSNRSSSSSSQQQQHGASSHSTSSKTHSHSNSKGGGGGGHHRDHHHHHHHHHRDSTSSSNHQHTDHSTTPKRKTDKRLSLSGSHSSRTSSSKSLTEVGGGAVGGVSLSSPPTSKPSGNVNQVLSPLPQTPPTNRTLGVGVPVTPDNSMMIPPHMLAYVGVVDPVGPKTPIQAYPGGWGGGGATPEVHPLQRAILIQSQYSSQGYQVSPHQQTIASLPTTPIQSFPPPPPPPPPPPSSTVGTSPLNPQNVVLSMGYPQVPGGGGAYHYEQQPLPVSSQKLKVPMSRLGVWPRPEIDFPDPNSLKPLPQLPSNDFFNVGLIQNWSSSLETINKQMDSAQIESLSRTTVDVAYHCGQLAKNLLALECCRMKAVSRRTRLNDLMKTIDVIEKR